MDPSSSSPTILRSKRCTELPATCMDDPLSGSAIRGPSRNNKRRKRKLHNMAFASSKTIIALTLCCWIGFLVYSYVQLNQMLLRRQLDQSGYTTFEPTSTQEQHTQEHTQVAIDPFVKVRETLPVLPEEHTDIGLPLLQHQKELQQLLHQADQKAPKFLIFEGESLSGQGAGNLMSGLLAVHLLGVEFNRIVCVVPQWHFHVAFELIDSKTQKLCDDFFEQHPPNLNQERIKMVNFMKPPNECELKETLASDEKQALYIEANTYCRWRPVPPNFFFQIYKPRQRLLDVLPYNTEDPPKTVVHLRLHDTESDHRKGLDEDSLNALGDFLSQQNDTPFLVTNHVPWFDYFRKKYGWKHPDWAKVTHSVLNIKNWGSRKTGEAATALVVTEESLRKQRREEKKQQKIQLWADWYSILRAKQVYHTYSDFSLSAIHWMGSYPGTNELSIWSRTLLGVDPVTKELQLGEEPFVVDAPMPRLVDRVGADQLGHCKNQKGPAGVQVLGTRLVNKTVTAKNPPEKFDYKAWQDNKAEKKDPPAKLDFSKTWKDNKRLDLDVSAPANQAFIQKSLSITDEQRAQMKEWHRMREEHDGTQEQQPLDVDQLTSKVSAALKKQKEAWDNEV